MRSARTIQQLVSAELLLLLVAAPAAAQWNQNASTGPFFYTDPANWVGGTINNTFSSNWTSGMNVSWDADYTMSGGINMSATGGLDVTFRSDSATARTIKMAGNWTRSGGGTMTIGTVDNPLILDLNGATRTFGGSTATVRINAKITNTGGNNAGILLNANLGYSHLTNNDNDFDGPVTFDRRGGSFSSIKNVGGGPSALGAPTTAANGQITVNDITSFGQFDYTGTGDTSDRNIFFNFNQNNGIPIRNTGSGKLTLTGKFEFNSSSRSVQVQATNADFDILGVISEGGSALRAIEFGGGGVTTRTITLGSNNTYSGKTTINNVTLVVPSLKDAGSASSLGDATSTDAVIGIGNAGNAGRLRYTGGGDTTNRAIDLAGTTGGATIQASGSGALVFTSDFQASGAGSKTLTLGGTNTDLNEIRGSIVDNSASNRTSVTKNEAGTWFLSGTSTYTGDSTLAGGTVLVQKLSDTNTGSSLGSAGTIRFNGSSLTYVGSGDSSNRPFAIGPPTSAGGTGAVNATLRASGSSALTLTGTVDLGNFSNSGRSLALAGTNTDLNTLASTLTNGSSTFSLTKSGPGRWLVSGSNSYTGSTTINEGTLVAGHNNAFGSGPLALNAGTLDLGDRALAVGALSGAAGGTITTSSNAAASLSTTVGSGTVTFAGVIEDGAGTVALTKAGSGRLTLAGDNTYQGSTAIAAGVLEIAPAGSLANTSAISVDAGARFVYNAATALPIAPTLLGDGLANRAVLAGIGRIDASITLDNLGDTLAPGNSPGILPFGASQNWSSFTYEWETNDFTGQTAGTAFDQVQINGGLTLLGIEGSFMLDVLSLTAGNVPGTVPNFSEITREWAIITTTDGISGFNRLHWSLDTSGFTPVGEGGWDIKLSESGNDLVLVYYAVVPEPGTVVLAGLGLAGFAGIAARARQRQRSGA